MDNQFVNKKVWGVGMLAVVSVFIAGLVYVKDSNRIGGLSAMQSQAGWYKSGLRMPVGGSTLIKNFECDVFWRGSGDGVINDQDIEIIGRLSVGSELVSGSLEFQKADCAPLSTRGDGKINVQDLVQAGRFAKGLDTLVEAGGPTGPVENWECDVYPVGSDGRVTVEDWNRVGQMSVGNATVTSGLEFQKADCAPKSTGGDGRIDVADWVQAGRYAQGLDQLQPVSGPNSPVAQNWECDVAPMGGDGLVNMADYERVGQFSVGNETSENGLEFQKADCAPKATNGDGRIDVADWVQAGRYAQGLDPKQPAGGPTSPTFGW